MIFIYIYNTFLTIIFTIAMSLSLGAYLKERKRNYLLISLYFLLLILNNLVITLSEYFDSFARIYNSQFMINPIFQTLYYLGVIGIAFVLVNELIAEKVKTYQYVIYAFFALWLIIVPFLQNSAIKVWFYYLPSQVLIIYLGIYLLKHYKINEKLPIRWQRYTKSIAYLSIAFGFMILLEDTFVIFFKDTYEQNLLSIYNRNISENIFHISLCFLAIRYFLFSYKESASQAGETVPIIVHLPENKEGDEHQSGHANKGQIYFDKFVESYNITPREAEVLFLLLKHRHNQEIASELYLSLGTVKTHTHNIFIKLSVEKRSEVSRVFENFIKSESEK